MAENENVPKVDNAVAAALHADFKSYSLPQDFNAKTTSDSIKDYWKNYRNAIIACHENKQEDTAFNYWKKMESSSPATSLLDFLFYRNKNDMTGVNYFFSTYVQFETQKLIYNVDYGDNCTYYDSFQKGKTSVSAEQAKKDYTDKLNEWFYYLLELDETKDKELTVLKLIAEKLKIDIKSAKKEDLENALKDYTKKNNLRTIRAICAR